MALRPFPGTRKAPRCMCCRSLHPKIRRCIPSLPEVLVVPWCTSFPCWPCPRSREALGLSLRGMHTRLHCLMPATEVPVPTPFSPCPSAALSPVVMETHAYPKGRFGLFIENGNCTDTFTQTRDGKAKGEVRPPPAAQVVREGSLAGKGVAASRSPQWEPPVTQPGGRKTMAESHTHTHKKSREQRQEEGEKVGGGDLLLPQPSHGVGSLCGEDTDVYVLGILLGREMCV